MDVLVDAAAERGYSAMPVLSYAGHDARQMAAICPSAMIFIPCRGGLSHIESEWAEPEHVAAGAQLLCDAAALLAMVPQTTAWADGQPRMAHLGRPSAHLIWAMCIDQMFANPGTWRHHVVRQFPRRMTAMRARFKQDEKSSTVYKNHFAAPDNYLEIGEFEQSFGQIAIKHRYTSIVIDGNQFRLVSDADSALVKSDNLSESHCRFVNSQHFALVMKSGRRGLSL